MAMYPIASPAKVRMPIAQPPSTIPPMASPPSATAPRATPPSAMTPVALSPMAMIPRACPRNSLLVGSGPIATETRGYPRKAAEDFQRTGMGNSRGFIARVLFKAPSAPSIIAVDRLQLLKYRVGVEKGAAKRDLASAASAAMVRVLLHNGLPLRRRDQHWSWPLAEEADQSLDVLGSRRQEKLLTNKL